MELYPYPVGVEWGGCVARLREERGKRARVRGESAGAWGIHLELYPCTFGRRGMGRLLLAENGKEAVREG